MKKLTLILSACFFLNSCFILGLAGKKVLDNKLTPDHTKEGEKQLREQGYSNIKTDLTNYGCSSDTLVFLNGFEATDKSNNPVKGCFCYNLSKELLIIFK